MQGSHGVQSEPGYKYGGHAACAAGGVAHWLKLQPQCQLALAMTALPEDSTTEVGRMNQRGTSSVT